MKRELSANEVSRLRDLIGSLVKGAGRESTSGLRDYSGSLVKGDSPRCGEMSKGSLVKGAGREFTSGLRDLYRLPCKGSWL